MTRLLVLLLILFISACSEKVNFITATSVGLELEAAPKPRINIGAKRLELYSAPTYTEGDLPPVLSSFKLNGTVFDPRIKQVYATGASATLVQLKGAEEKYQTALLALISDNDKNLDISKLKLLGVVKRPDNPQESYSVVATGTTYGLDIGYSNLGLGHLLIGFERYVASSIPIASDVGCGDGSTSGCDYYPSAVAAVDVRFTAGNSGKYLSKNSSQQKIAQNMVNEDQVEGVSPPEAAIDAVQFFATGRAAQALALNEQLQEIFLEEAQGGISQSRRLSNLAKGDALRLTSCYLDADIAKRKSILRFAEGVGVLKPKEVDLNLNTEDQVKSLIKWTNLRANTSDEKTSKAFEKLREFACDNK